LNEIQIPWNKKMYAIGAEDVEENVLLTSIIYE
jgi:hypothetical protein